TLYEQDQMIERPDAFLMRIALNLSIDAHRAVASRGDEVCVEDVVVIDCSPSTEAVVLARERTARLSVCIGRLTPKARDIFLSYRLEGMTYREIAQRHGLTISTVEKHVARATMQLAAWMEEW
uniref:RNA polymerase sigma factor n=1 Tax=Pelomonas sp. KK5 TaxID=1855730 RepID=UPI001E36498C